MNEPDDNTAIRTLVDILHHAQKTGTALWTAAFALHHLQLVGGWWRLRRWGCGAVTVFISTGRGTCARRIENGNKKAMRCEGSQRPHSSQKQSRKGGPPGKSGAKSSGR